MSSLIYEARDSANTTKYKPKDGDTLASIVAANAGKFASWQDLALYNWGTAVPTEVNRVLRETIGCSAVDPADPSNTVLKVHPDAANPDLFLAKPWSFLSLLMGKTYVFTATQPRPANAVSLEALDRWFIPAKEACQVRYSVEGSKVTAKKVTFEVYGSNYAAPGAWNKGLATFPAAADKPDVVLYANDEQTDVPERAAGVDVKEWRGTVTATDGALGTKNPPPPGPAGPAGPPGPGGDPTARVVNVAFSPYTALLRYYLDDADKKARIVLLPFWVQFDAAGAPVAASLKVQWNVKDTSRFEGGKGSGQLIVVDGKGAVVFRKPLKPDEMKTKGGGPIEFVWAGGTYNEPGGPGAPAKTNSKGGTAAIPDDMPYRVRLEMHTVADEPKGLALAAMHTEVRLYVAPGTQPDTLNPYVAVTDKSSMALSVSQDLLTTKTTLARGDGTEWLKLQLAKGGFHPGPVDGNAGQAEYKIALAEFKRSVPKKQANPGDNFARFTLDATEGDDVKDALEVLLASSDWQRPWFGDPTAARADMDLPSATARLNDAAKAIIVWVDDRHTYTDPDWIPAAAPGPTTRTTVNTAPAATGNHMKGYTSGDNAVTYKAQSIPRPCIPLAADFILLGRGDDLTSVLAPPADADLALMRKAIGPLRVDWTFDEIDTEPAGEPTTDVTQYDKRVTRTHAFDVATLTAQMSTPAYARKDVHLQATYHNCPTAAGGIRTAPASYYKQPFALGPESLLPWQPLDVTSRESVATIVHDNLGQGAPDLVMARVGMAGVYFRPSIIGGDGYRVRAQVQFLKEGGYNLPNLDVLKARYPLLPQVQSAAMRVWKKASVRAYVRWTDAGTFAASSAATFKIFEPGYLHFAYERGDAAVDSAITDWLADDANFKTLVKSALPPGAAPQSPTWKRGQDANIKLTANRMWPWYPDGQYGLYDPSPPNVTMSVAVFGVNNVGGLLNNVVNPIFYSLSNLIGLNVINSVEQKKGKLRGHVIIEMTVSETLYMQQYACVTCHNNFYYADKSVNGGTMRGAACPSPGCAGTLSLLGPHFHGHYTSANGHHEVWPEANLTGGTFVGANSPTDHTPLAADQVPRERYRCTTCAFNGWLAESGAGGDHQGEACMTVGCAGTLESVGPTTEKYVCDKGDGGDVELAEAHTAGGSHVGQEHATCTQSPKGHLQRKAPPGITITHTLVNGNKVIMARTEPAIGAVPIPSIGLPLGVAFNFSNDPELWAHESGHCRHMEHAGNAPGFNDAQHDAVVNGSFNWAGIGENTPFPAGGARLDGQHWDRDCFMTYTNQRATYTRPRDRAYPCGQCALKLRGWRLAGIATVPAATKDP
jgi:hypothetical protein